MVEESKGIDAFETFMIEDAGRQPAESARPGEEEASQPSKAPTTTPSPEPAPFTHDPVPASERLRPALDRIPNASPAAVRLALKNGIKIAGLKGSGRGGQVIEADGQKASSSENAATTTGVIAAAASYVDTPITSMRKVIAERLTESVHQSPHYFVSARVSVSKLLKLRQALNASADGAYKLSVNDFLIKACAVACKRVSSRQLRLERRIYSSVPQCRH